MWQLAWTRLLLWTRLFLLVTCGYALMCGGAVHAQSAGSIEPLETVRSAEGVFLTASLHFELTPQIDEALRQGVPMYFVAEAQLRRERWYWSDQIVASASRYYRLSYQPLTRRWRLLMSSSPLSVSGLGLALAQSFETLEDSLSAMQRIHRWKIAESGLVSSLGGMMVQLRFGLDLAQLPRPLQIGALGRTGWNLQLSRSRVLDGDDGDK